ncbi:PD-(D/E)XK motif protein [Luteococcus sanguinis]|uniref:PD-(D/E)XK motif protein n=1 Tax=Luteococcus sanguinis TaxID=174038 RepID=A0ABW1WZP3_9ACTN
MTDSYMEFSIALSQVWNSDHPTLIGRPVGLPETGLLLAADSKGQRHILAPLAEGQTFEAQVWDNLRLTEAEFKSRRYLDLICSSDDLSKVFAAFADQVIRQTVSEKRPAADSLQRTLREWKQLLKPAPALSEEEARGLFGELVVLRELVRRNSGFALDSWSGPEMDLHDFTTPKGDIEVKTSRTEGLDVTISSIHQLDAPPDRPLVLARLRVESSPQGRNITDMVTELCRAGLLRDELVQKLAGARFVLGGDPDTNRFLAPEPPAVWAVDDNFPGLRSTDIPEHRRGPIKRVKYTLDLVAAGPPMAAEEFHHYMDRIMTA